MAAGSTYTPIQSYTLGSAQATVTFSSIPSTYTDLILVVGSAASGADYSHFRVNGDTGTNYSLTDLVGNAVSAYTDRVANTALTYSGYVTTSPGTIIMNFQNYATTTTYKTVLSRTATDSGEPVRVAVNLWRSTAAINSITLYNGGSKNWATGGVFTLYGIAAA